MLRWKLIPPGLGARAVAQGAQRDRELCGPALVGDHGSHRPARVPVHVETAAGTGAGAQHGPAAHAAATPTGVAQLAVVLESRRGGPEDEAVLEVVVRVEDDAEGIRVVEVRVAARVRCDDARRVAVVQHGADIDRFVVEQDPNFGAFGGGLALEGFGLDEVGQRLRRGPHILIESAVDRRRLDGRNGAADPDARGRLVFGGHAEPGREGQAGNGEQGNGREAHNRSNLPCGCVPRTFRNRAAPAASSRPVKPA